MARADEHRCRPPQGAGANDGNACRVQTSFRRRQVQIDVRHVRRPVRRVDVVDVAERARGVAADRRDHGLHARRARRRSGSRAAPRRAGSRARRGPSRGRSCRPGSTGASRVLGGLLESVIVHLDALHASGGHVAVLRRWCRRSRTRVSRGPCRRGTRGTAGRAGAWDRSRTPAPRRRARRRRPSARGRSTTPRRVAAKTIAGIASETRYAHQNVTSIPW